MMNNTDNIWQKEYSDLTQEEKLYVSEWCEDAQDYERIRHFMVNMSNVEKTEVKPSEKVKQDLLNQFPAQQQKSKGFWLNMFPFFFTPEGQMNWKPVMAVAVLVGVIVTVVFMNDPFGGSQEDQLAENTVKEDASREETKEESGIETKEEEVTEEETEADSNEQFSNTTEKTMHDDNNQNNQPLKDAESEKTSPKTESEEKATIVYSSNSDKEAAIEDNFADQQRSSDELNLDESSDDNDMTLGAAQSSTPSSPQEKSITDQSREPLQKKDEGVDLQGSNEEKDTKSAFSGFFRNKRKAAQSNSAPAAEKSVAVDEELEASNNPQGKENETSSANNEDIQRLLFATY